MNTGTFHQLHDTGNEYILAVTDGIDLHFLAPDVLIHQHRFLLVDLNRSTQIMPKLCFVGDDLHGPSSKNEAGTNQNRVTDFLCGRNAGFYAGNGFSGRLRNVQLEQQLFKGVPVFCLFNGGAVGSDECDPQIVQRLGQIDSCLSTKRSNDTFRLLHRYDIIDILHGQRLKIELVGAGVVCGNGFRVVIDNDGFIPGFLDGLHGMNGGIIKFHALSNANWAGAKDNDLFAL